MSQWQEQVWRERGATLTVWMDAWPKQRHGRLERRELWALADPELNRYTGSTGTVGEAWPHLQQVCRVHRRRTVKGRVQLEVSYAVTKLKPRWNLHLWGAEDRLRCHSEALPPILEGRFGTAA